MKNESAFTKKASAFLKKVRSSQGGEAPPQRDPVTQLVVAFLEWNATRAAAKSAHARITAELVDNNDLRVSHAHEIVELLGPRYPRAEERAQRLHESLQEIYLREHAISLESLAGKPRKTVRQYLDSLPGMTSYVATQVGLVSFNVGGVPVDDNTLELLLVEELVDPSASTDEASAFLEKLIKDEECLETHLALQAWSEANAGKAAKKAAK